MSQIESQAGFRAGSRADAQAAGSLERGIDLLLHLQRAGSAQGVSEIGRALDWPKSTVHRLLSTLTSRGWVERDERGRYRPGFGLVALGLGALASEPLVAAARPVLEACARQLEETVFVVADRAGDLVVLDKAEGSGFLRAAPQVGSRVPIHATASGSLYLAHAPERLRQPDGEPERFTQRTRTARAERDQAARQARQRGWALNREEWIPGLSVVAAPILVEDSLRGVVALAASTPRLEQIGLEKAAAAVVGAAERVAGRLEGQTGSMEGASR
ncbi:MAG: IclR family transcriptional regulator [Myxococcota bacterium]